MCFTAETLVKVENGHKAISEIEAGDYVYSENIATGEKGYKKVKQIFVSEVTTLYHIRVKDQEIKTTAPHPFYVIGKGWVEAEDLVVGDQLRMANGETIKVEAITIEKLKTQVKVYNFEVEDWHVYYVSNLEVLVHNKGGPCSADYMAKEVVEAGSQSLEIKFPKSNDDMKQVFGVTDKVFDKNNNPDIGVDELGNIVLKGVSTGRRCQQIGHLKALNHKIKLSGG